MNRRPFVSLFSFVLVAFVLGLLGWFTQSEMVRWAALAIALALISVGLGVNSLIIALHTDRKMSKIEATLPRIETLQEEVRKEQAEQKEERGSSSQVVSTLQAISQYYMNFINKAKEEDKN